MKTLNATFKSQKNAGANSPICLYTIENFDGLGNNLNYAEYDADVTFAGVLYTKFPITHEFVTENTQGSADSVRVRVSNVARVIEAYLVTYDFRGKRVRIKRVFADQLSDPTSFIEDIFYIDSYTANQEEVEFVLSSKFDVLDLTLPKRTYLRNYCQWRFKSTECGYAGVATACNKTLAQCRTYANQVRYGANPSIPSDNTYAG